MEKEQEKVQNWPYTTKINDWEKLISRVMSHFDVFGDFSKEKIESVLKPAAVELYDKNYSSIIPKDQAKRRRIRNPLRRVPNGTTSIITQADADEFKRIVTERHFRLGLVSASGILEKQLSYLETINEIIKHAPANPENNLKGIDDAILTLKSRKNAVDSLFYNCNPSTKMDEEKFTKVQKKLVRPNIKTKLKTLSDHLKVELGQGNITWTGKSPIDIKTVKKIKRYLEDKVNDSKFDAIKERQKSEAEEKLSAMEKATNTVKKRRFRKNLVTVGIYDGYKDDIRLVYSYYLAKKELEKVRIANEYHSKCLENVFKHLEMTDHKGVTSQSIADARQLLTNVINRDEGLIDALIGLAIDIKKTINFENLKKFKGLLESDIEDKKSNPEKASLVENLKEDLNSIKGLLLEKKNNVQVGEVMHDRFPKETTLEEKRDHEITAEGNLVVENSSSDGKASLNPTPKKVEANPSIAGGKMHGKTKHENGIQVEGVVNANENILVVVSDARGAARPIKKQGDKKEVVDSSTVLEISDVSTVNVVNSTNDVVQIEKVTLANKGAASISDDALNIEISNDKFSENEDDRTVIYDTAQVTSPVNKVIGVNSPNDDVSKDNLSSEYKKHAPVSVSDSDAVANTEIYDRQIPKNEEDGSVASRSGSGTSDEGEVVPFVNSQIVHPQIENLSIENKVVTSIPDDAAIHKLLAELNYYETLIKYNEDNIKDHDLEKLENSLRSKALQEYKKRHAKSRSTRFVNYLANLTGIKKYATTVEERENYKRLWIDAFMAMHMEDNRRKFNLRRERAPIQTIQTAVFSEAKDILRERINRIKYYDLYRLPFKWKLERKIVGLERLEKRYHKAIQETKNTFDGISNFIDDQMRRIAKEDKKDWDRLGPLMVNKRFPNTKMGIQDRINRCVKEDKLLPYLTKSVFDKNDKNILYAKSHFIKKTIAYSEKLIKDNDPKKAENSIRSSALREYNKIYKKSRSTRFLNYLANLTGLRKYPTPEAKKEKKDFKDTWIAGFVVDKMGDKKKNFQDRSRETTQTLISATAFNEANDALGERVNKIKYYDLFRLPFKWKLKRLKMGLELLDKRFANVIEGNQRVINGFDGYIKDRNDFINNKVKTWDWSEQKWRDFGYQLKDTTNERKVEELVVGTLSKKAPNNRINGPEDNRGQLGLGLSKGVLQVNRATNMNPFDRQESLHENKDGLTDLFDELSSNDSQNRALHGDFNNRSAIVSVLESVLGVSTLLDTVDEESINNLNERLSKIVGENSNRYDNEEERLGIWERFEKAYNKNEDECVQYLKELGFKEDKIEVFVHVSKFYALGKENNDYKPLIAYQEDLIQQSNLKLRDALPSLRSLAQWGWLKDYVEELFEFKIQINRCLPFALETLAKLESSSTTHNESDDIRRAVTDLTTMFVKGQVDQITEDYLQMQKSALPEIMDFYLRSGRQEIRDAINNPETGGNIDEHPSFTGSTKIVAFDDVGKTESTLSSGGVNSKGTSNKTTASDGNAKNSTDLTKRRSAHQKRSSSKVSL